MGIPKAKEIINHTIGEVGLLISPDVDTQIDLETAGAKLNFDSPPTGWGYYGLTTQDTAINSDVSVYESKVGVPEFTIKRFLVGVEGTVTGTFLESDIEIHDMIAGDGIIKNIKLGTSEALASVDGVTITTTGKANEDQYAVGNSVICETLDADIASSFNAARITAKDISGTDMILTFAESFFRTAPAGGDFINSCLYAVATLASASGSREFQAMLVYESREGVQFIYHFPKIVFTPNVSPDFPNTGQVFQMPFEFKVIGIPADTGQAGAASMFSSTDKVLGYYYELYDRF